MCRVCFTAAFEFIAGQGYCREKDCNGCNRDHEMLAAGKDNCVSSLDECKLKCRRKVGCQGVSYTATPGDTDQDGYAHIMF